MKKLHLLDKNRSCLSPREISRFKSEITKQKNSPICSSSSTNDVAKVGAEKMKADKFQLVKVRLDV